MPYIVNVPSFAVTAAYLDALPGGKPTDLPAFMKEVEEWVLSDYAGALMAGSAVDPGRRAAVIEQMHQVHRDSRPSTWTSRT